MMTAAPISLPSFAAAMVSGVLPLWQARQMMEFLPKSRGVLWTNSLLLTQPDFSVRLSRSIKVFAGVQSTQRAAAAHEIDVLDAALVLLVLQNFSDDGLDVSVLVMHCITLLHFILNCLDSFRRFPEELSLP